MKTFSGLEFVKGVIFIISLVGVLFSIQSKLSSAEPEFPVSISVQAGNVTQLFVNTTTVSRRWAGFYGNLSGDII